MDAPSALVLLTCLDFDLVRAGIEELTELDDATVVVSSLLSQECLIVLVEVLRVSQSLVITIHSLKKRISLKALRHFDVDSHK